MTRRLTAIELDDALTKLSEAVGKLSPQQRAELRADMPAGIMAGADQALAAQAASIAATKQGDRVTFIPRTDVDDWIRLGLLDTLIGWISGRGKVCMHMPTHRRPEPVFAAAWKPGLVVCAHCLHLLDVAGAADMTCDVCGRVCEGLDADDPVYPGSVWLGELAFQFGTCGDCRPASEGVA